MTRMGPVVVAVVGVLALAAVEAPADVFNMGGTRNPDGSWTGLASLETVPVGDPGNAQDTRYGRNYTGSPFDPLGYGGVGYTYNIGKYEVTAGQYTEFLNAVASTDMCGLYDSNMWSNVAGCKIQRSGSSGSYTYSVASDYANRPANFVSWGSAARFANWLHNNQPTGAQDLTTTEDGAYYLDGATSNVALLAVNRKANWKWAITSEDEWYKAAYYKGGSTDAGYWDYPTSSDTEPGRDLNDVSGNNANYYGTPFPIQSPYRTTVAGQFMNSESPYGTLDQGGNVWELNESVHYASYHGMRGGSFSYGAYLHASDREITFDPKFVYFSIGFRVVQVPEPATLMLLALGGLAVMRRRYSRLG